jgi:ketosteroid isomerase-like protein
MTVTATDQTILRHLLESWADAVRRKDIDGVLAHRADDILLFDVVPPLQSRGIGEYRTSWVDQFFPWCGSDGRFELSDVEISAGDRVAFATGLIRCAGTENSTRVEYTVRLTVGFEKRDDRWIAVHEHHSEPLRADRPDSSREDAAVGLGRES